MKASLIPIGNSRGIRLPKALLEQCQMKDEVEIKVEEGEIILKAIREPRKDWAQAAKRLSEQGGDELMLGDIPNRFDEEEWEW